ncbi:Thymidylate synthase [Apilactobacillus kunkeei]|uniref:thymidylate synthase n=1 Tax=Apilactobacillus TaxID=2767877 RepID=UPI001C6FA4B0|nr:MULTISPECIES: thymidylate synthase [Apilactobacillus]MBX8454985.1 thymidylate synthase [Apilactobacillus kunkeei]MDN2613249.1 thymidylate synthase [Apilactobacillus sp. EABW-1NA]QYU54527.1 thymidylate synthase [Apilactobacillus kunkeei]CAI2552817.1 Thymidylate synthase [Apilactobacillus kunkeei]CAI2553204.1 Thymidylate synthase [Apilactobacillus kunkeei]
MSNTKNETTALINVLDKIDKNGEIVCTRGFEQKEILANLEIISHPSERIILLHNRGNNIFALIAETIWVLAGHNDMEYLQRYLPRAVDFSDDGKIWRAAYGPRLRNWHGVDQFKSVISRIKEDKNTKRAVMSIFDPEIDYVDSLDIPCNNWLHFMNRDNKLNLDVAVRANDAIWGFGGINTFEWSVLLQCMSYWTNDKVGHMNWYTGTIHLYSRHYKKAGNILKNNINPKTIYDFDVPTLKFNTPFEKFDIMLENIFNLEKNMRNDKDISKTWTEVNKIKDDLFRNFSQMLFIYNLFLNNKNNSLIKKYVELMETSDLKIAAIEYFSRKFSDKNMFKLNNKEQNFFNYYWK